MKILELFAGTRSISKEFEKAGHEVFTIEFDTVHPNIGWYADIMTITADQIIERFGFPDVIWASPPCTTYSIAGISHHRKVVDGIMKPKSEEAIKSDDLILRVFNLINHLKPKYFFIENPMGGLRKMDFMTNIDLILNQKVKRETVTYCQYGDNRMKPTDIWTNHPDPHFKPKCKNGDPCHVSAPRGSRTGTQGIKNVIDKSRIPEKLCRHIVQICEMNV